MGGSRMGTALLVVQQKYFLLKDKLTSHFKALLI